MSRNILITGANRGIGLAMAQQLSAQGDTVYALVRKASDALSQCNQVQIIENIDVTDTDALKSATQSLAGVNIDILINNAGILADEVLGNLDFESIRRQFEVNCLGPLKVTEAFLGNLSDGSKVAQVTSRMGSIEDNTSGGRYGYRISKTALNSASMSLARDLKPNGIAVALLHPGYVQTDMVNNMGDVSAATAAKGLLQRIEELDLNNSGSFWHANGELLPW